ncbi:ADP-ribosyltransferase [Chryseobacterium rhizosphaerae]|uniref:ADP-ribosyltransferase n=1 Tax=Chryseobacterium rhizosphaerae TaxID=395937 RepID=UPI003D109610
MIYKYINYRFPQIFEKFINFSLQKQISKDFIPNNYNYFLSPNSINNWGKAHSDYLEFNQKEYNNAGIEHLQYYAGWVYYNINLFLRSGKDKLDQTDDVGYITKRISGIYNEMQKFSLDENIVVVRRVSNAFLRNYLLRGKRLKKGITICDGAFLSTSIDLSYRKNLNSKYEPLNNETLIFIKIPKGCNGIYIESISKREEYELLLPTNLNLVVEKQYKFFNNHLIFSQVHL